MQKFNKVTTQSNIIKNLLATTYLPLIKTVRQGDYICSDRLYVYKCNVIYCTESGYIGDLKFLFNSPIAKWRELQEFHFGDRDGKLSTNYVSSNEGYDFRTHERLGQYLRNLRDMYGLNLLPLYNCFSNQFLETHYITKSKVQETTEDYSTKIYKIPIKFNQDYTICIENIGVTTISPAFIRHSSLLKMNNTRQGNGVDMTNQYIGLHMGDVISSYSGLSYGTPIKVRFNNVPEKKEAKRENSVTIKEFKKVELNDIANINKYFNREYMTKLSANKHIDNYGYVYEYTDNGLVGIEPNDITKVGYYYSRKYSPKRLNWYILKDDEYTLEYDDRDRALIDSFYYAVYNETTIIKSYEITEEMCSKYSDVEDKLYMLIQVPASFNSNITVLEGDYTEISSQKLVDERIIGVLPDFLYDKYYTHDLSLMNRNYSYPVSFTNELIEFLLWNSISLLDSINNNMDRLSIDLKDKYIPNSENANYPNYWQDRYRQLISDYVNYNGTNYIQNNIGYVTRNIEELIKKDI